MPHWGPPGRTLSGASLNGTHGDSQWHTWRVAMAGMESRNGRQSQWEKHGSQREAWRRAEASCGWAACSAAHAREELTLPSCELPFFRFPETAAGVSTRAEASGSADLGSRCERWTRWKWAASALSMKGFFLTCVHTRAPPGENTAVAGAPRGDGVARHAPSWTVYDYFLLTESVAWCVITL